MTKARKKPSTNRKKAPPVSTGENTTADRAPGGRFAPGSSGNPKGRPPGSRNKLGEEFVDAVLNDFRKYGPQVITKVRTKEPSTYLRVVASLVPKETTLVMDSGPLGHLSDQELNLLIDKLLEQANGDK